MFPLLALSTELILCIASYLDQVDLLNVSLTCRSLKSITECELYREYTNPKLYSRPIASFIRRLLQNPVLVKNVKYVDLKGWDNLDFLDPKDFENSSDAGTSKERRNKILEFDEYRNPEPTEDEYYACTMIAKGAGMIEEVLPYEVKSAVIETARPMLSTDIAARQKWYTYVFDKNLSFEEVSSDRRFCQMLRAGIDDAYANLLLAWLPNVDEMFLRGLEANETVLALPKPDHGYRSLKILKAGSMDLQGAWDITYLNGIISGASLRSLHIHNASSWGSNGYECSKHLMLRPGSLQLTKLELDQCALKASDMRVLLDATPSLRSLLYYTGHLDTGEYNFNAAELIDMLDCVRDNLEELFLEIVQYWAEEFDDGAENLIASLSHFTALKTLDTIPSMWQDMQDIDEVTDSRSREPEQDLSRRLPRSPQKLVFHPPYEPHRWGARIVPQLPDVRQIVDVMEKYPELLPNLEEIYIGSATADDGYRFEKELDKYAADLNGPIVGVHVGRHNSTPTKSFFGDTPSNGRLSEIRWNGNKYSAIPPEKTQVWKNIYKDRTMEQVLAEETFDPEVERLMHLREADARLGLFRSLFEPSTSSDSDE